MGRGGRKTAHKATDNLPQAFCRKQRELRSLGGISSRMMYLRSEDDMKQFRQSLFEQSPLHLRRAMLQFRRDDLDEAEKELLYQNDHKYLATSELPLRLQDTKDEELASYLAALLSLRGYNQQADRRIAKLLEQARKEVDHGGVVLDLSQIEILLAFVSTNRCQEKLEECLRFSRSAFQNRKIPFPESTETLLLPPIVSALASNCDQTSLKESGLRSGRFYPHEDVILITDDPAVVDRSLVVHELVHAVQGRGEKHYPHMKHIFEALTERLSKEIAGDDYRTDWGAEKIWLSLESQIDRKKLDKISLQPQEKMIRSLAAELYPKEKKPLQHLFQDFS